MKSEQNVRWLVIDIVLPLMEIEGGFAPPELDPMPAGRMRIAFPRDCSIMPDPVEEAGATTQQVVVCLDGLPCLMVSSKDGQIPSCLNIGDDWVTVTGIDGLKTDPHGSADEDVKWSEAKRFWDDARELAWHDNHCWRNIVEAMARGRCSMTMTFSGEWTKIAGAAEADAHQPMTALEVPDHTSEGEGIAENGNTKEPTVEDGKATQPPQLTRTAPITDVAGGAESGAPSIGQTRASTGRTCSLLPAAEIIANHHETCHREDTSETPVSSISEREGEKPDKEQSDEQWAESQWGE